MPRYVLILSSGKRVEYESRKALDIGCIVDLGELGRWRMAAVQTFDTDIFDEQDALPNEIEAVFRCRPAPPR